MATPFETHSKRNLRLLAFFVLFGGAFGALVLGLGYRQLIMQEEYALQAERQSMRRILQPAPRGNIYDRNGNLLVGNRARFSAVVYVDEALRSEMRRAYYARVRRERERLEALPEAERPSIDRSRLLWESRQEVLQGYLDTINAVTGRNETISLEEVKRHFSQRLLLHLPLMSDLSRQEYARIEEQIPPANPVQIYTESARYYPQGSLAAHTLGYVVSSDSLPDEGVPGEEYTTFFIEGKEGKTGIERTFDERLRGRSGGQVWQVDPVGYQYQLVSEKLPQPGDGVVTSLDLLMQRAAEEALGGRTGAVVALEVDTGEALVIASKPDYNLNDMTPFITHEVWNELVEREALLNRAVQGVYPPGSTYKLVTALAALRAGTLEPDTVLYCPGAFRVGNRLFPEHSGRRAFGEIALPRALEVSSNVFFYQVGVATGIHPIAAQARELGLGQPTGIEIPGEGDRTLVPGPEWKRRVHNDGWRPGDTANVAIGQGYLLVSPLQMASLGASLARRETRTPPTVVHDPAGNRKAVAEAAEPLGVSDEEYAAIVEGMRRAVETGTARFAQVPGVEVAGKTGTAQVRIKGRRTTLAWFLGFAPIEEPEVAVAVVVEGTEEGDDYAGGRTAAPVARAVLEAWFRSDREAPSGGGGTFVQRD